MANILKNVGKALGGFAKGVASVAAGIFIPGPVGVKASSSIAAIGTGKAKAGTPVVKAAASVPAVAKATTSAAAKNPVVKVNTPLTTKAVGSGWEWPWQKDKKADYWATNWWKVGLLALIPVGLVIGLVYIIKVSSKKAVGGGGGSRTKTVYVDSGNGGGGGGSAPKASGSRKRKRSGALNAQARKAQAMSPAERKAWAQRMQAARRKKKAK